jgi:hypothetical protein
MMDESEFHGVYKNHAIFCGLGTYFTAKITGAWPSCKTVDELKEAIDRQDEAGTIVCQCKANAALRGE